jgi:hypothetical protein
MAAVWQYRSAAAAAGEDAEDGAQDGVEGS